MSDWDKNIICRDVSEFMYVYDRFTGLLIFCHKGGMCDIP